MIIKILLIIIFILKASPVVIKSIDGKRNKHFVLISIILWLVILIKFLIDVWK